MFNVGWTEMVVIACVAILVVGPKDLPGMLRTFGRTVGSLRRMAGDFQRQFNDALKEAEREAGLDEVQKAASFKPLEDARKSAEAFQTSVKNSIKELEDGAAPDSGPAETVAAKTPPAEAVAMTDGKTGSAGTKAKAAAKATASKPAAKTPAKTEAAKPAARKTAKAEGTKPAGAKKTVTGAKG